MKNLANNRKGQTAVEYTLSLVFIVLIILFALKNSVVREAVIVAADNIQNAVTVDE